MPKRILLIDDSPDVQDLLRYCAGRAWRRAEVDWYDPTASGKPEPSFDWSRYDVVLLDDRPGIEGEDGLLWLREFRRRGALPPVIVLAENVSRESSERARSLGARYYIDKHDLSPRVLANAVKTALRDREAAGSESAGEISDDEKSFDDTEWVAVNDVAPILESETSLPTEPEPPASETADEAPDAQGLPVMGAIPGYRMIDVIANGTSSSIYLAVREKDERRVALKVISTDVEDDKQLLRRFMREQRVLAQLRHPNVVKIYGGGVTEGAAYLAMEHFPGGDLRTRIKEGIDEQKGLEYFRGIARGLGAAHDMGIIHRDIKPANILLRADDSVAIADFGISKSLGASTAITVVGFVMGTPYYISPEQIDGEAADRRSDLYSLGVILFELLTGERPYPETSLPALLRAHTENPVPRLPEEHDDMQFVIDGLLAKKPKDRFQSVDELMVALGPE